MQQSADGSSSFIAIRDITAGEPLTYSYGPLSNQALLLGYGFVLQDNPRDRVDLLQGREEVAALFDSHAQLGGGREVGVE